MSLKLNEISKFLSFAKKLVHLSEQIIKKNSPQKLKINFKYDKSPVTKIDTAIEKKLRSLNKNLNYTPTPLPSCDDKKCNLTEQTHSGLCA